jgi:hypothetical protein
MVYPEFGYLSSQSVGLVSGDEYQLVVILAFVRECMCGRYGSGSTESTSGVVPHAATGTGLPRFTVILDSVGYGVCCGYGDGRLTLHCDPLVRTCYGYRDGNAALYATVYDSNVHMSSNIASARKSMQNVSCTVSRMTSIPND